VTVKARTTVTVLATRVEIATVNTIPNAICWRIQLAVFRYPVKSKDQRKQQGREMSKM
jgi:hypothetical protein